MQAQLGTLAQYEQLQTEVTQTENTAQQIYASRTLFSEVLGDISLVIPDSVWIADMTLTAPAGSAPGRRRAGGGHGRDTRQPDDRHGNTYTFEDVARRRPAATRAVAAPT